MNHNNRELKGFVSLIGAGLCYALYGVFTRIVSHDFGMYFQYFSRFVVMTVILFAAWKLLGPGKKIEARDRVWFLVIGLAAIGTNIAYYPAVLNLTLATTMFLFYAFSVIVSYIFGKLFFGEKITGIKIISVVIALFGVWLIYSAEFEVNKIMFMVYASLAGACFGLHSSATKKVSGTYPSVQVSFVSTWMGLIAYGFLFLIMREPVYLHIFTPSWAANFAFAVVAIGSVVLTVYGFRYIEAQKASLVLLSELVFVVIAGIVIYREMPSLKSTLGSVFVLTALILPNINFFRKNTL